MLSLFFVTWIVLNVVTKGSIDKTTLDEIFVILFNVYLIGKMYIAIKYGYINLKYWEFDRDENKKLYNVAFAVLVIIIAISSIAAFKVLFIT
jgi:hypothetical protein